MHWILYAALVFGDPVVDERAYDVDKAYHKFAKDVPKITICDWYPQRPCGYIKYLISWSNGGNNGE